jgi:hypothetical protein
MWIVPAVVGGAWSMRMADGATQPLVLEQRFQEVTGTLGTAALTDVRLRGTSIRFKAGERVFEGLVADAAIEGPGWRAVRAD